MKQKQFGTQETLQNLKSLARTRLSANNLREIVKLPEGENELEWISLHVMDFYNQISMLFGVTKEVCTKTGCSIMNAGPKWEFYWSDSTTLFKKPSTIINSQTFSTRIH